jgi:uncharacterized protein (TIGR02391 family)
MAMPAPWPDGEEIVELPVDELGMRILWFLADKAIDKAHTRQGFIADRTMQVVQEERRPTQGFSATYSHEALRAERHVARALAEAWDWLTGEGLIAVDPVAIEVSARPVVDPYFVTRWGREVASEGAKGLDLTRARRRLGVELHSELAGPLRRLVRVGAFEEAAFTAFREIEQRVATMAQNPASKHGRPLRGEQLMNAAFNAEDGPLADPEAEPAEQQGQMNLFKGAFAALRNPLGHRSVEFTDPTEAAEVVLFADLLMRQLDHVGDRLRAAGGVSSS